MVGNAGMIEAEVVLISKKSDEDDVRWVYLDIGKFGGLAETMDKSIRYPIRTPRDGEAMAGPASSPVRPATRPTCCTRRDALGSRSVSKLATGCAVEGTGAYTATYAAVAFNGFQPLQPPTSDGETACSGAALRLRRGGARYGSKEVERW